jgi:hypothetical protein
VEVLLSRFPFGTFIVFCVLAGAHSARAQVPDNPPGLEIGVDASLAGGDVGSERSHVRVSPRLTVNVSPRTAFVVSGDVMTTKRAFGFDESWEDSRLVTVELRRALLQTGSLAVYGVTGGGVGYRRLFRDEFVIPGPFGPTVLPSLQRNEVGGEVTLGIGAEQRVATRLALRQEVRLNLGEVSELRAQAGVSVPLGRYLPEFETPRTRSGGRPDSLRNGTGLGALIGAAAVAGFVGFLGSALCEGECENLPAAVAIGAGYGAAAGALSGAVVDSFIE